MSNSPRARVLFVIGSLGAGGAERQQMEVLKRLDRSRFAPRLYLAYRHGELLGEVPSDVPVLSFVDGSREETWTARLAGKLRLLSEARAWQLRNILSAEPIDLVFSWGVRMAYETALATRGRKAARIAYCVAEPPVELSGDFLPATPWRRRLARWAYGTADRVYGNSNGVRRQLIELYGLSPAQVELFPNLRDFSRLEAQAAAFVPAWPSEGAKIVTVGRLHFQKGHAVLLDALADLVHARGIPAQLLIVGQGPHENELRQQVRALNLERRVEFAGFQSNPAPFYRHADLFVMPSLSEGLPNVLIEAVALGTPSIAADCPTGPREILDDGRFGTLVPPGNSAALAEAAARVLSQLPEERLKIRAAQGAFRARYDIETGIAPLEQRLLDVIRESQERNRRG